MAIVTSPRPGVTFSARNDTRNHNNCPRPLTLFFFYALDRLYHAAKNKKTGLLPTEEYTIAKDLKHVNVIRTLDCVCTPDHM